MAQQHAKTAHPTKRGPGRYHKDGVQHGKPINTGRHGKHVPRITGLHTGLTSRHLQPQRLEDETFADYRQRRAFANRALRGLAF